MPFNALQETDFFGRAEELAALTRRVAGAEPGLSQSVVLSGPLGMGKTELLKQLFGHLFWRQDSVAPFYYTVNPALLSAAAFSKDYLSRFLCQRLAFENREQHLFYLDGISINGLSVLAEERNAVWATEILDRYIQSSDDPRDALRVAIAAPLLSAVSSGKPVAVLIDEFHRMKDLHIDGAADPRLVSLLGQPMSLRKTPHVISGNTAVISEMTVAGGLGRIAVRPLGPEDSALRARSVLRALAAEGGTPPHLLRHMGGNPLYLGCLSRSAGAKSGHEEKDFREAYAREIIEGALARSWTSELKEFFPDLGQRRNALAIAHKILHTKEPLSCQRIARIFALTEGQAESIAHSLHLAGFVRGEFGVFRPVEDRVLQDVLDCLYKREILGKTSSDLEREFLEQALPEQERTVRFDLTLPMVKEAELVAAQCLEQIGKNLNLNQDTIGRMQIAVIEACINAIEHSKGTEKKVYVSVAAGTRLEVTIESAGREFVVQETGEPFRDCERPNATGRGWGIKLMKRFADEVRFEKTERGTKTVLVKNLADSADAPKEDSAYRE